MPTEGLIFFARQGNVVRSNAHAARALAAMEVELKVNSRVSAFNEEFPETARMKLPEWIRPEWLEPIIDGGEKLGTALVLPAPSGRGSQLRSSSGVTSRSRSTHLGIALSRFFAPVRLWG